MILNKNAPAANGGAVKNSATRSYPAGASLQLPTG
jgi:hypothetical protein